MSRPQPIALLELQQLCGLGLGFNALALDLLNPLQRLFCAEAVELAWTDSQRQRHCTGTLAEASVSDGMGGETDDPPPGVLRFVRADTPEVELRLRGVAAETLPLIKRRWSLAASCLRQALMAAPSADETLLPLKQAPDVGFWLFDDQLRCVSRCAQGILIMAQSGIGAAQDGVAGSPIHERLAGLRQSDAPHPDDYQWRQRGRLAWYALSAKRLRSVDGSSSRMAVRIQRLHAAAVHAAQKLSAFPLSRRQRDVALAMALGQRNADIAARLELKISTVAELAKAVLAQTGMSSREVLREHLLGDG